MSFGREMQDFIGAYQAGTQIANVAADTKYKKWRMGDYGDDGPMPPSSFGADGQPLGETEGPQVTAGGEKKGGYKSITKPGEIEAEIRKVAAKYNIDGDVAVRVAKSEGGLDDPVRQSTVPRKDGKGNERSYGPFQLYIDGGLGNLALKAGIDPRNPEQWRESIDFALQNAAKSGWGQWYGAAKAGIGDWQGIGGPHRKPSSQPSVATESVTYDDVEPTAAKPGVGIPEDAGPTEDTAPAEPGTEEEDPQMAASNPEFTVADADVPEVTGAVVVDEDPYTMYAARGGAIPDDYRGGRYGRSV